MSSPSAAPSRTLAYRPDIDGLRALAVLPVLCFHAGFTAFSGGFVGVDVFFVVSGYLVTRLILGEGDAFSLVRFYERRARRILPALFVVLTASLAAAWWWFLPADLAAFSRSLAAVLGLSSNVYFWRSALDYFARPTDLVPLLHTWSLAVEKQYYLLFPLGIMVLRRVASQPPSWSMFTRILPVLFFKRVCDVWDEETAEAAETFGDIDPSAFPEVHRFSVPEGCHWRDVREASSNVGSALLHAMQEIERANPDTLYRVFGTADWSNREKFTDELLKDLIEGFSAVPLGNKTVRTDVLGDAYENLVGKFADVTRRNKAGEFYTPRSVVRMMVEMLDPKPGESIYDPACGTGGMLLGVIEHVTRQGGDPRTFFGKIYGQEKNLTTSSIARMNLVLHGIEDFQIAREDTLRNPAFADASTGGLLTFDCVIANPPFSLKDWAPRCATCVKQAWTARAIGSTDRATPERSRVGATTRAPSVLNTTAELHVC